MDDPELKLLPCRLGSATYLTAHACQQNRDRLAKLDRIKHMKRRLADKMTGIADDADMLEPCRTCPGAIELGRRSPEKIRIMIRTKHDRPIPRCPTGHLMTAENTGLDHGKRRCLACRRERRRGDRRSAGGPALMVDRAEGSGT